MIMLIEDSHEITSALIQSMPEIEFVVVHSMSDLVGKMAFLPHVDVVISDIILEGESGLDLCKIIRGIDPKIDFIFFSGMSSVLEEELKDFGAKKIYDKFNLRSSDFFSVIPNLAKQKLKERNLLIVEDSSNE